MSSTDSNITFQFSLNLQFGQSLLASKSLDYLSRSGQRSRSNYSTFFSTKMDSNSKERTGNGDQRSGNNNTNTDQHSFKVFCTCEGAVVAVHEKSEHEKPAILFTENEVLGRESGEDSVRPEYQVKWEGLNDPDNPRSMRVSRKWVILMILASISLCSWDTPFY
jgi:hypothetical protein